MKKIQSIFIILCCICFFPVISSAKSLDFYVEPKLPDNQYRQNVGFYDLIVKPSQKQTLELKLVNSSDKEVRIKPLLKQARTNLNGVVEYGKTKDKLDKEVPYKIEDVVVPVEKEIVLPKQGEKVLHLQINMPKQAYKGLLAGGITLKNELDKGETDTEAKDSAMSITNQFAYVIGIVIRESEEELPSKLSMGEVKPSQVNHRNVINATLYNKKAKFMNEVEVDAQVFKKNNHDKPVYHSVSRNMKMAPNSYFKYPVKLNGQEMKPGKYMMDLTVKSKNNEKWHFTKEFKIDRKMAKKYNELDVLVEKDNTRLYMLIGFGVVLTLLLIGMYLVQRKNKKEKAMLRNQIKLADQTKGKKKKRRRK